MIYNQVAEILKDRPSWYRDCRAVDVLNAMSTGNGGTIELLYMQVKNLILCLSHFIRKLALFIDCFRA